MSETIFQSFIKKPKLLALRGAIRHSDWGGTAFIPSLLNIENKEQRPFAELWIGAHHTDPSQVQFDNFEIGLDQLIEKAPQQILGKPVIEKFGPRLPYLFKVLDAREMLSIQVHPSKTQADEGFARENAASIPMSAPNRNYKDDNHKPEVHVALTDFWMLHGFRPGKEIEKLITEIPEFQELKSDYAQHGLRGLYETVMTMEHSRVSRILEKLLQRLRPRYEAGELNKDQPSFWAVRAADNFPLPDGHRDRGIFSIYLLNLLHLEPGQGTFQDASVPHAYLLGTTIELMANSDNVLRGGLTRKHIAVEELLNTLRFEAGRPEILTGTAVSSTERIYQTPSPDFQLSCITVTPDNAHRSPQPHGLDSLIVLDGTGQMAFFESRRPFHRGDIFLAPADIPYTIETTSSKSVLYKATVPLS